MTFVRRFRPRSEQLEGRAVPAVYYVSPTGSDANPGTSDLPWQTLQSAADRVAAGDTVNVRAGDYAGFDLWTDGTSAAPITFHAEPGARVVSPNRRTSDGINLEGADWVVIEGFTVVNQPRAGIRAVLDQHVTVRGNTCDNNGTWGIFTGFSDDLLIEGNVASRSQTQHGIYVSNSGDRPVIRGNTVWGNYAAGIHMNGDVSQGGDGIISNALVEDNVIHDNGVGGGSAINCDGVQDSVFRNNLIFNTHASGISLYRTDGADGSKNNRVENNTFLVAADGRWAVNVSDGSTGNTVRNNILFSAQSFRGAISVTADSLPGFVSDYNAVEDRFSADGGNTAIGLAQWQAQTGQDAHSFAVADPNLLFVDAAGGDYHLAAGSPAIDAGTSAGAPATDYEGDPRPSGAGYDIGHDEYVPNLPPPPANTPPTISDVTNQTVRRNGTTGSIAFTVGDAETPAGSLVVTATSSNPALVPASGIALGGSGADRTVTVTPKKNRTGTAVITLTVTDAGGLTATDTFVVTVTR